MMKSNYTIILAIILMACMAPSMQVSADFGLTTSTDAYTVDTDAGLVFQIRRVDYGSSTQSPGDIMSLVYNGVEYQDQSRGSHINSGFDWLGYDTSNVTVSAQVVDADHIKITVVTDELTHYYIARNGYPQIYMGTYFTTQPITGGGLCRYIVRMPYSNLPYGPPPSDLTGTTGAIESADVYGMANGETRSKHYSNMRLKDWDYIGATGDHVGVWMLRDNQEGGSGGPFYRCLLNQGGSDQEVTYIINYGEGQTEDLRKDILNSYTLVFTDGAVPDSVDSSWLNGMGMIGYVDAPDRGNVHCGGITGRDTRYDYTVRFANSAAQYWADASDVDGSFYAEGLIPGVYTLTVYKNEYGVHTDTVTVTAGQTTPVSAIAITSDPAFTTPLWRIGEWDGTPREFVNGDRVNIMHPSDVRMESWNPGTFVVGTSTAAEGIPCYQWKDINGTQTIQFALTAGQVVASALRVGITCAYEGGRPNIGVNSWTSSFQGPSSQPDTRTLTVGTYRGNNVIYSFSVPASALVTGTNTLYVYPISGSGSTGYLSAGYSLDCIDLIQGLATTSLPATPASLNATPSTGSVALSWPAAAGATSYLVRRATESGGPYMTITETASTNYSDNDVNEGTTYYYIVKGLNIAGAGLPSSEAIAVTSGTFGPYVHLEFDESSGVTASDSSGNGWDGTLAGGATFVSGMIGNAVNLDGSSQYVSFTTGVVSQCNDFTVATWVYLDSSEIWTRIFDFGDSEIYYMTLISEASSGNPRFKFYTASDVEQIIDSTVAIPTGTWTHIAVTLSGDTGIIYVNGVPTGTASSMTLRPYHLGDTEQNYLGRSQSDDDPYLDGMLDDFRIYSRGLTGAEIYDLWGGSANNAPAFDARPTVLSAIDPDVDYSTLGENLTNEVTDDDGDTLTFTKISGPEWLTVASGGTLSGAPDNSNIGLNQFVIRVSDPSGATDTAEVQITVNNVPIAPLGLDASRSGSVVVLSGYASPNADSYNIKRATVSGGSYTTIATGVTDDVYSDTTADESTVYFYVVSAVNGLGESDDSDEADVIVSDLVAWLKFDETDGDAASDSSGNAWDGALINSPAWSEGELSNSLAFSSGSSQFVTLPERVVSGLGDFTICAWVNVTSFESWPRIFDFGTDTSNYMFLTTQYSGSSALMRFAIRTASVSEQQIDSSTAISAGVWTHVAVTLSGSTGRLYINGTQVGSNPSMTLNPASLGNTTQNYLGKSQWDDPYFNGALDDLRIYSRALSVAELTALVYPDPEAPDNVTGIPEDGGATLNWDAGNAADSYNVKRAIVSGGPYTTIASDLTIRTYPDTGLTNGVTYYYVVSSNNTQGESGDSAEVAITPSTLRMHLKFDETSGSVAYDSSGRGLDAGTINSPAWETGQLDNAVHLVSASSQYVELSQGVLDDLTDFSITGWVYLDSVTMWTRVFDFGTDTTPDASTGSYMFLTPYSGGNAIRFAMTTSGYNNEEQINGTAALSSGSWIHVAVTLSGSTGQLYVDGSPVGSNTSMTITPSSLGSITRGYIGKSIFATDPYLNGLADDFRVYSEALSADDVATLANGEELNNAPYFISDPIAKSDATVAVAYTGETLSGDAADSDPGDMLTFSKVSGASWLSVASDGALSGTPGSGDAGANSFTVRVTDSEGDYDEATLNITVIATNSSPYWLSDPVAKVYATVGVAYTGQTLAGDAADDDLGDTLTFSKVDGPSWLSVASDGALSGTPGSGDTGVNSFTVRVTDSQSAQDDATLNITVLSVDESSSVSGHWVLY
ncbi:hypothetical protein JXA32_00075 [Candidatus Sumerlaeota bacterium]|nr:hypothetical protein [Candidatus Sumerlaeota bacterium]